MSIDKVRKGSIDDITPEEWNSLNDVAVGARHDPVNQPSHYRVGEVEAIDYIAQQLGMGVKDYLLGNVHKYLHRHRFKGNALEDLKKTQWYLSRLIMEEEQGG
jgi:hypothetical protein